MREGSPSHLQLRLPRGIHEITRGGDLIHDAHMAQTGSIQAIGIQGPHELIERGVLVGGHGHAVGGRHLLHTPCQPHIRPIMHKLELTPHQLALVWGLKF